MCIRDRTIFVLPHPFGPRIAVIPDRSSILTGDMKDLNPTSSSLDRLTFVLFRIDAP